MTDDAEALAAKAAGDRAMRQSAFADAAAHYARAVARAPTLVAAWANLALAHLRAEQFDACVTAATRTLELDPTHVKALYRRAQAHAAAHAPARAVADLERVLRLQVRATSALRVPRQHVRSRGPPRSPTIARRRRRWPTPSGRCTGQPPVRRA